MAALLTVEEALARVLARVTPLPAERVALGEAAGRIVAEAPLAATDLPPFASSAMDGFALRAADVPGTLPVAVRIAAGSAAPRPLRAGEAMGIATGGVVPNGADTVVPLERAADHGDRVEMPAAAPGDNIRPAGGDVRRGDPVLEAGASLGAPQLAALAAAGVTAVACARRPRAAVLVTGTELAAPGQPLAPGQIYESNGLMLAGLLTAAGATVERLAPVADDHEAHRTALARALEADVVITSGGVSVGPHDLVRAVAGELGVEEVFWGVAMRPGKPLAFGVRGASLVFGLPGNPVSSLVGALLFVCPAVRALQGALDPGPRWQAGSLDAPLRQNAHRDDFARAIARPTAGGVGLAPITGQESHMIVHTAAANAIVHVPRGAGELEAGAGVRFLAV